MNYGIIRRILGWVMLLEGAFLLPPSVIGACYGEHQIARIYLIIGLCAMAAGFALKSLPLKSRTFFAREGFVTTALSWIILALIGALPFTISGEIPSYVDALFEVISGFTTTGASILTNVEAMSHANLFWRSFTHWLGGMGVLVFILAILPMTGGSTMNLMRAESPGPSVGKLVPKIQQTAFYLYAIYFCMTVLLIVLLILAGMPVFDSFCTAFGTAGTGGFGVKADSIAGYSRLIQNIITLFMMLFGVNFSFYFYLLSRRYREALGMEEVRWYAGIYFAAVAIVTCSVTMAGSGRTVWENTQDALFQVASVMTTTGFATLNFNKWPQLARAVMVLVMFVGACAGSTGGGIKVSRIVLYIKQLRIEMMQQLHPRSVRTLRMDGKSVSRQVIQSSNTFLMAYILIFVFSFLIVTCDGFDLVTNFTAVTATINNIGPGLNVVGPAGNFSAFSDLSKFVLMFDMLAGRLEIIPMLALFHPFTWKK